jgi:kumamolisin
LRALLGISLVLLAGAGLLLPAAAAAGKRDPALSAEQVEALIFLRHPRGLDRFVRSVSDPASPRYRDYASVETLIRRFGASKATQKKTLRWMAGRGLHGTVSPTGAYITALAPRRRAARLLPRIGGARASAASGLSRRVPAALRGTVTRVALLSTRPAASANAPRPLRAGLAAVASKGKKRAYSSILRHSGTASGCAAGSSGGLGPPLEPFTPNQYLTAYGQAAMHAKGLQGQGQTIAVVETGGFRRSDIATFDRCFGVKTPPIRAVPVDARKPRAPEDETTLDLEMLSVGAPKVDRILVYEGLESQGGVAITAGAALGSPGNRPNVISISLGLCEPELSGSLALRSIFDNIFAVAAGAGISTLVSSGDTGSSGCQTENSTGEAIALPIRAVSVPASSPYATAVGGTNLELSKQNRIKKEIVWNDLPIQPNGGGGGGSIVTPQRPWWQTGIHRYGAGRIVPDIAALADIYPGYAFFCTAKPCAELEQKVPGWGSIGGTSAAAPLMAAGIALANQYAAEHGERPLGFLNPLLYRLGAEARSRRSAFFDVTEGNDDLGRLLLPEAGGGRPLGCCHARVGYDWASGWGSLKIPSFAKLAVGAGHRASLH